MLDEFIPESKDYISNNRKEIWNLFKERVILPFVGGVGICCISIVFGLMFKFIKFEQGEAGIIQILELASDSLFIFAFIVFGAMFLFICEFLRLFKPYLINIIARFMLLQVKLYFNISCSGMSILSGVALFFCGSSGWLNSIGFLPQRYEFIEYLIIAVCMCFWSFVLSLVPNILESKNKYPNLAKISWFVVVFFLCYSLKSILN